MGLVCLFCCGWWRCVPCRHGRATYFPTNLPGSALVGLWVLVRQVLMTADLTFLDLLRLRVGLRQVYDLRHVLV